ncbi:hypothetical protein [Brucella anthropi]|uniref:hypothetical protein n=1 Tax=Brucella anthropi TaxID=529 RepID=UPI000F67AFA1|nr:hypothetical protein [Brucella anthropi]RRY08826.1 hypothetical protein EGJ58_13065 [Brucella anthropi]
MKTIALDLGEILAGHMPGARHDRDDEAAKLPIPEAQVATLRELFGRYAKGCEFTEGDIVTPRAGSMYRGRGLPHVVLDAPDEPHFHFSKEDNSSPSFGARLDVRVACFVPGGNIMAYWMESYQLEPWDADATYPTEKE